MKNLALLLFLLIAVTFGFRYQPPAELLASEDSYVTYTKQVKPLLINNCASCHTKSSGLVDFSDYESAYDYRFEIAGKIVTKEMPHSGEYNLSKENINTILEWINTGARK